MYLIFSIIKSVRGCYDKGLVRQVRGFVSISVPRKQNIRTENGL